MSSKAKPWKKQQGGKFKKKGRGFKKQQDDNVPRGTATPLHAAARAGDAATIAATVKEFQEKNAAAAVDARDEHGRTALHLACWAGHGGATRALLEAGAAPGLGAADDVTALHFAAQAGDRADMDSSRLAASRRRARGRNGRLLGTPVDARRPARSTPSRRSSTPARR